MAHRVIRGQPLPSRSRGAGGDFQGRQKRTALPDEVAQGKRDQSDQEKFESAQAPVEIEGVAVEDKGLLRKTAQFGLLPAAFVAKGINKLTGNKLTGGQDLTTNEIASLTADTPIGFGLGLGTVAAATFLGARAGGRFLPKSITGGFRPTKVKGGRNVPFVTDNTIKNYMRKNAIPRSEFGQVKRQLGVMRAQDVAKVLKDSQGGMLAKLTRGAFGGKRLGTGILLGWLGADTIAQSTSVQASRIEGNVIFGQMSKSEALTELDKLQTFNNVGKAAVLAAGVISPAAIPFLIFGWQSTSLSSNQIERSKRVVQGL